MSQPAGLARRSHYIPEAYLRGWSQDGLRVHAYRLLVPRPDYPVWQRRSISSLGVWDDLYTSMEEGQEHDEIERWLNREFETPAAIPLAKVRRGEGLSADDFRHLARYLACLDVRTPEAYLEARERARASVPRLLKSVLRGLRGARADRPQRLAAPAPAPPLTRPVPELPIAFRQERKGRQVEVSAEVTIGRQLWLHSLVGLLTNAVRVLSDHSWQILEAAKGYSWFTCDHPVLRLNFESPTRYDLHGGWNRKGGDLMLPLSPTHMLHTRIGYRESSHDRLSVEQTKLIQRILAQRAGRWIFAHREMVRAEALRPRSVDMEAFSHEESGRRNWHRDQTR